MARRVDWKLFMILKFNLSAQAGIIVLFSFLLIAPALAQSTVVDFYGKDLIIGKQIEIAEDINGSFSVAEVSKNVKFVKSTTQVPNFGLSKSTWWAKFSISNHTPDSLIYLELAYPMIHSMQLY